MMYILVGSICLSIGAYIGWIKGEKSGIEYGFKRGKESWRYSLIDCVVHAGNCPECGKPIGVAITPNRNLTTKEFRKILED